MRCEYLTSFLLIDLALTSVATCADPQSAVSSAELIKPVDLATLSNDDIIWHAGRYGFHPELTGCAAKADGRLALSDVAVLQKKLADPHTFIASHVLLTRHFGCGWSDPSTNYNGLELDMTAQGETIIGPSSLPNLVRQWKDKLANLKRDNKSLHRPTSAPSSPSK